MTNTTETLTTKEILTVALDAYLEGRDKEAAVLIAAVEAHALQEGINDYLCRASDVNRGYEAPTWAWPLDGADEAYVNAVGTAEICRVIGLPESAWDEISDIWLGAFCAGYRAAHETE